MVLETLPKDVVEAVSTKLPGDLAGVPIRRRCVATQYEAREICSLGPGMAIEYLAQISQFIVCHILNGAILSALAGVDVITVRVPFCYVRPCSLPFGRLVRSSLFAPGLLQVLVEHQERRGCGGHPGNTQDAVKDQPSAGKVTVGILRPGRVSGH
jgi:hypothetical protein